ncbi:iron complex outermembrane recepter protein [Faunimonas pinastri]|uniref:Iron complex outermembrane recepter protein n=1 Tax=Faunimonas pinastri TaxID=1855383 RepID=A0A1H9LIQ7_9HYPH|nr:TonB-dependent siderophore receptor [Faunimonas pinastri]SER11392.1 iron complex outermembrane recepter protein [Faunimonas pinastri]
MVRQKQVAEGGRDGSVERALSGTRKRTLMFLLCGTALVLPAHSFAQDAAAAGDTIQLDTVEVQGRGESAVGPDATIVARSTSTGSKTDTPLQDLSSAVSVVTEKEMQTRAVNDTQEALSYTAGVSTDEYGSDDRYDWVRIRGFYETGIGIYRDGLPRRSNGYTEGKIEPYGLQRYEILKGSTSTLFGLNAPGGLVNAITKRPRSEKFGEVYTTLGDGHVETGTDFGGPLDADAKWSYRMTAKWQDADRNADHTQDDHFYVAPAVTWRPNDTTSLTVLGDYNKRKSDSGHAIPLGSGIDPDAFLGEPDFDKFNSTEKSIGYLFEHDFENGLKFRQNARYTDLEVSLESVYGASADEAAGRYAYAVDGHTRQFSIDSQLEYSASFGRFDSRTLLGTDYTHLKTHEFRQYGTAAGIDIYNPVYCGRSCVDLTTGSNWDNKQDANGVYLQEELTLDKRWILTLGGRFDWIHTETDFSDTGIGYDANDDAFTKRIGLTYKAFDNLSLYGNYSESFQPIDADRTSLVGKPEPQEGKQYEIGAKFRPGDLNALFTVALFDLTQTNVPYNVSVTEQSQVGEINVKGLELEGKFGLTDRINLTAAYSYLDAEIVHDGVGTTEGNRPQLVPKHMASLWTDYTIPGDGGRRGDLTFGIGARYVGNTFSDNENTVKVDGHTVVDAALCYQVTKKASLAVNATNLFDKEYISSVDTYSNNAYYGDRRTVKATFKYTW